MTRTAVLTATALTFVLSAQPAIAQELSRYRDYALETSVAAVVKTSGVRETEVRTLHTRPATIQQVEWRAPYVWSGSVAADPVNNVLFSFVDDRLYEIFVSYDRDRTDGMTSADVIESISATYGAPLPARPARGVVSVGGFDAVLLAQWENDAALVTLRRLPDVPRFQLVFVSKALNGRARAAVAEAIRLDAVDAPQRNLDLRTKEAAAALLKSDEVRTANRAGFRP